MDLLIVNVYQNGSLSLNKSVYRARHQIIYWNQPYNRRDCCDKMQGSGKITCAIIHTICRQTRARCELTAYTPSSSIQLSATVRHLDITYMCYELRTPLLSGQFRQPKQSDLHTTVSKPVTVRPDRARCIYPCDIISTTKTAFIYISHKIILVCVCSCVHIDGYQIKRNTLSRCCFDVGSPLAQNYVSF